MTKQNFYQCVETEYCCLMVDEYGDKLLFTVQDGAIEDELSMFLSEKDVRSLISRMELWLNEK